MHKIHKEICNFINFIVEEGSITTHHDDFEKENDLSKKRDIFMEYITLLDDLLLQFFGSLENRFSQSIIKKHEILVVDKSKTIVYVFKYPEITEANITYLETVFSDYMLGFGKLKNESILKRIYRIENFLVSKSEVKGVNKYLTVINSKNFFFILDSGI